jgi:uncharacterized tellurite resistance protein B-like protein
MPRLIVDKGPDRSRNIPLEAGIKLVVGRDASCDFVVADQSCSRRHFAVIEKDGKYFLKDLKSTHGTLVNGWNVETTPLNDGDAISAGETVFSFVAEASESGSRGLVGKNLAGYQVLDRLGRGGMGTVYRAKQVALDRDVALKVLSQRYSSDKTFVNRFFKEAQAAARLNHPNVVQIYDVREEKGLYLISMEMMDSGTVEDRVAKEGPLPIADVVRIARDAAQGLVYAEKKGIVHRDIKPDNLMLNAEGTTKISDLGLARDTSSEVGQEGEEGIFGTPHFIAPEQAQGKAVDSRSDIYSLGASLYRLVSGTTPFQGDSVGSIIRQQINDEPQDLRELRPECPSDLADLISVMMAKEPADRFENAEALATAVGTLSESGTIASGGGQMGLIAAGVAALVIAGGAAWFLTRDNREPEPTPTPIAENGGNGESGIDPAEQARLERTRLENEVDRLFIAAQRFELGLKEAGRGDDPDALDEVATKLREAIAAGPDTDKSAAVRKELARIETRAQEIRAEAEANAEALAQEKARIDAAWNALESEVNEAIDRDAFALALKAQMASSETLKGSPREAEAAALLAEILKRAGERTKEQETAAMRAIAQGDFAGARDALDGLATAIEEGLEEGPEFVLLRDYVRALRTKRGEVDELEAAKRRADLAADQSAHFDFLKKHYAQVAQSLDYEAMIQALERAEESLATEACRPRVAELKSDLERMLALRSTISGHLADPKAKPLSISSAAKHLPRGNVVEVKQDGLVVQDRRGDREDIAWDKIPFDEALRYIFRRTANEPRELLDLAIACRECGLAEEGQEALEALEDQDLGALAPELRSLRAAMGLEASAQAKLAEIRALHAKAKGGDDAAWFPLRRELKDFFRNFRSTRTLLRASDGGRYFPER